MKITNVEAFALRVPPIGENCVWGWDSAIVKITTDEGIVGWGEADSSPFILRTMINMPNTNYISYGMKELLIGENPLDIERLWNKMYQMTLHHGRVGVAIHCISAIDIALWDIAGQYYGVPVYQLLGGKYRDYINAYGTIIPDDDHEKTAELAVNAVKEGGFKLIKSGGGKFGTTEEFDVAHTKALREALGDDIGVSVDVCKQWKDFGTALSRIKKLESYHLDWVEEPVEPMDFHSYRRLSEMVSTKISGGEALTTAREFNEFLQVAKPAIVQPDISNCGGITEMKKIDMLAKLNGSKLIPHGFGTGILFAATVHFLASSEYGDTMEYSTSASPLFRYLDRNLVKSVDAKVYVPDRPGLGVDIDEAVIAEYEVKEIF